MEVPTPLLVYRINQVFLLKTALKSESSFHLNNIRSTKVLMKWKSMNKKLPLMKINPELILDTKDKEERKIKGVKDRPSKILSPHKVRMMRKRNAISRTQFIKNPNSLKKSIRKRNIENLKHKVIIEIEDSGILSHLKIV